MVRVCVVALVLVGLSASTAMAQVEWEASASADLAPVPPPPEMPPVPPAPNTSTTYAQPVPAATPADEEEGPSFAPVGYGALIGAIGGLVFTGVVMNDCNGGACGMVILLTPVFVTVGAAGGALLGLLSIPFIEAGKDDDTRVAASVAPTEGGAVAAVAGTF